MINIFHQNNYQCEEKDQSPIFKQLHFHYFSKNYYSGNKERNHMYSTISRVCPLIILLELAEIGLTLTEVLDSLVEIGAMLSIVNDERLIR